MTDSIAADELRQIIERLERLQSEEQDAKDAKAEVFADAKGRGFDVPTIRTILARRKKNPDDVAEADALRDLYENAIGA
tara:strand:- start:1288 stop:1524 length:237 start_codon:yes stop_codon:yes gene_type:complete